MIKIIQPIKIILILIAWFCLLLPTTNAQEDALMVDTLNVYQKMILDLEQKGVNLMDVFNDTILADKLNNQFDLSVDSLRYYYMLKYYGGQELEVGNKDHFAIIGKSYGDSIVIRWAPNSPTLADKVYEYGFGLVRISMMKDNQGFVTRNDSSANAIQLLADSLNPIKQWTLEQIEQALPESKVLTSSDSMALIAAWSIYGSDDSSTNVGKGLNYISRSKESDMKFGVSLLMADRSSLAAEILGLRYVDRNVELGKRYKYVLIPIGQSIELYALTELFNDPSKNKKIEDLEILEEDGALTLIWPKEKNKFSGYWIERSEDNGVTWQKLTKQPVVFVDNQDSPRTVYKNSKRDGELDYEENYIYTDTVKNYVKYNYRISGQTPFADYTDYAFVSGTATDLTPPPMPNVTEYYVDEETGLAHVSFEMNYSNAQLKDLKGFTVWDAPHVDSTFIQVSGLLPPNTRKYISPKPLEKNRQHHYVIKSVDKEGNTMSTFPLYMHIVDNIPPSIPKGLSYFINDTSGVVSLFWEANKDYDIEGYRVFFSNSLQNEFTQLTKGAYPDTVYYDTLALVTLSEEVYYKIRAEDKSYNGSAFSEIITVKRPDYVAPITPVLDVPKIQDECIQLNWRTSTSQDVVKQVLYRRLYKEEIEWMPFAEFDDATTNAFNDSTAFEESIYEYSIRALDDAGWYSDYAFPVKARRWFDGNVPTIDSLEARYNDETETIELNWKYEAPRHRLLDGEDYFFYIYRAIGTEPIVRYRMVNGEKLSFTDTRIDEEATYNYAIKVVFLNGKSSGLITRQIEVKK